MNDSDGNHILEWFIELEERLVELMRYVPYDSKTEDVPLPRASGVILEAGSLVDTVFRETMASDKDRGELSMRDFKPYFEKKHELSNLRSVLFQWPPRYVIPFAAWAASEDEASQRLDWWDAYTGMKHSRIESFPQATLGNAVETLCALHQVMSQSSFFWQPLLRKDMLTSLNLHIANFVNDLQGGDCVETVTVESNLFCTTLGARSFPEKISELRSDTVVQLAGKRLQRFLGLW
jgi:hypothetical protein